MDYTLIKNREGVAHDNLAKLYISYCKKEGFL